MEQNEPTRAERASKLIDDHQTSSNRRRLVTTVIVLIAVAGSAFGAQRVLGGDDAPVTDATPANATADFGFRLTPTLATGDDLPEPSVTVAVYEDYQCPSCATFEKNTGDFLRDAVRAGDIVLEYRPFSFLEGASTNRYATRAANAAACVADSAGVPEYAKFQAAAFAEQPEEGGPGPEDDTLIEWADEAGAPDAAPCIRDERFAEWIAQALAAGQELGVSSTPTVAINGSIVRVAGENGGSRLPGTEDIERAIKDLAR